jgi:hypothetical protein
MPLPVSVQSEKSTFRTTSRFGSTKLCPMKNTNNSPSVSPFL